MAKRKLKRDEPPTPLGREYARLESFQTHDPGLDDFPARRTYPARELTVWSASVGKAKLPLGPLGIRPNPCFSGDLVLCSTFSPGRVVAFDRETGARRWTLRLAYYGDPVYAPPNSDLIYAGTSQELHAIRPDTGRVAWTFSPYGRRGETMYSSPTVAAGRLFIGDRRGFLHCLAADTGEPLWRVLTSRAENDDVNSDPVVYGGWVVVGTNARLAVAYETASGREVWLRRLDDPCTRATPAGRGMAVLWTSRSAYLFSVADGTLRGRWQRRNRGVDHACLAGNRMLVVTHRAFGPDRLPWPFSVLRGYRGGSEVYAFPYPRWSQVALRYEALTGKVYEATAFGLGILNPRTGEREAVVHGFGTRMPGVPEDRVGLPSVVRDRLYVLSALGRVYALRHP